MSIALSIQDFCPTTVLNSSIFFSDSFNKFNWRACLQFVCTGRKPNACVQIFVSVELGPSYKCQNSHFQRCMAQRIDELHHQRLLWIIKLYSLNSLVRDQFESRNDPSLLYIYGLEKKLFVSFSHSSSETNPTIDFCNLICYSLFSSVSFTTLCNLHVYAHKLWVITLSQENPGNTFRKIKDYQFNNGGHIRTL